MPTPTHHPTGEHPEPAPVHHLDLEQKASELLGDLQGKRRRGQNLAREAGVSVLMTAMEAGDELEEHQADGVVTVQMLRGRATVTTPEGSYTLSPAQMLVFQPGVRHSVKADEQSVVLLTVTGGEDVH